MSNLIGTPLNEALGARLSDPKQLADMVNGWRSLVKLTVAEAAIMVGLPKRTLDGIEQGRGFRYPLMLLHAMRHVQAEVESLRAVQS